MFLLNSRSSLVTATPGKPARYNAVRQGHPFSRSYGVNLPSSLTRVISRALVSSTHLPVSVCGTVYNSLPRGFSRRTVLPLRIGSRRRSIYAGALRRTDFPIRQLLRKYTVNQSRAWNFYPRPPIGDNANRRYWNINQLSIAYAKRLGLGPTELKRTNLP